MEISEPLNDQPVRIITARQITRHLHHQNFIKIVVGSEFRRRRHVDKM